MGNYLFDEVKLVDHEIDDFENVMGVNNESNGELTVRKKMTKNEYETDEDVVT